jgi:hypothetical protein
MLPSCREVLTSLCDLGCLRCFCQYGGWWAGWSSLWLASRRRRDAIDCRMIAGCWLLVGRELSAGCWLVEPCSPNRLVVVFGYQVLIPKLSTSNLLTQVSEALALCSFVSPTCQVWHSPFIPQPPLPNLQKKLGSKKTGGFIPQLPSPSSLRRWGAARVYNIWQMLYTPQAPQPLTPAFPGESI